MENRRDLMSIFNAARFFLHHYARGYYPVKAGNWSAFQWNRLFIPLANPNGDDNYIAEAGKKHILQPGMLYYVPAFLPVEFSLDDKVFFLSVQNSVEIFPGVELFSGCQQMTVIPAPPEVGQLNKLMDSDKKNCYTDAVRAGGLVLSIQSSLTDYYNEEDFWKPLALREFSALTEYLDSKGNARTSVSDLAALYGVSRENFSRRFSRITGITPKQLIDRFVTSRCLKLIGSGCSIKECADMLQFSNEYVFSRYFKRNMGEAPSLWLRHRRNQLL